MSQSKTRAVIGIFVSLVLVQEEYSRLNAGEEAVEGKECEEFVGPLAEGELRELVQARGWEAGRERATKDAAKPFEAVELGASVTVYFGTWCHDSQREIPQLLDLLDKFKGDVPFAVRFVGVNKDKTEPRQLLAGEQVLSLPTFVVTRQGREVGRIVQRPPRGLGTDLDLLLTGSSRGLVSASEDVIRKYLFPTSANAKASIRPASAPHP